MKVRAPSLMILTIVALMAAALQSPVAFTQTSRQVAGQPGKPGSAQSADALRDPNYRSPSDRHKVVVGDRQFARSLQARGSRLVADYGSFQVLDVDTRAADALGSTSAAEEHDEFNLVMLNAGAIDTTTPQAAALRQPAGAFAGKRMHLVQFAGPIRPEWYDALSKTGVTVVTYIPSNAYLVYGDSASLAQVQQMAAKSAFVQWDGAYLDAYRIDPALSAAPDGQIAVQLVADAQANAATIALIDKLKRAEASRQAVLNYLNLIVTVPGAAIATIAAQPDVVSIQPYATPVKMDERQDQIVAGNLSGNNPSGPGYLTWLAGKGFTQAQFTTSGFGVDVTDSGLDNATISPNHFGLYVNGVRPGTSRVIYNRLEGTPNPPSGSCPSGSSLQGIDGHGTLNAHIIGGFNNLPNGAPHTDASGFHYGLGVAPFVKVGSSVIFDPDCFTSPNYANLQSKAYNDGARVSSNSWGANVGGAYNTDSQAYDALVRDAQPTGSTFATAGNQEMVIVFAAGNAGSGANTVGSPGTGKNVLTVGASENVNPFGGADGSGVGDTGSDSANDIIGFSSRGPTDDGRVKPDIVAPGTHITGGVWQVASPPANGQADPAFNASGVSGGVGHASFYPPGGQQWYTSSSGTSHSTPAVAGGAALVRQYFINQALPPPSPAMTKAYLVNSTSYMTGTSANDNLFSNNQGMGRMNLGAAFDGTARILRDQVGADRFTASGQSRIFTGKITDASKPFRVTLAWTDAPGPTSGNAFINNLDLVVTIGGNTYKGNVFTGANSTTGGAADTRDNLESVFAPGTFPVNTPFVITVQATNIAGDGVPNVGGALDQDFALVCANCVANATPVISAAGAALTAESFAPANGLPDPGETVTFDFSLQNVGTANTTNLVATLQPTGGVTAPSSPQTYGALTAGGAAVARSFTFTVDPALVCGEVMTATLALQDGATDLGTVQYTFTNGTAVVGMAENFDGVTAPALPAGWTATLAISQAGDLAWATSSSTSDSAPNNAFAPDPVHVTDNRLESPSIAISSSRAVLTFRNNYILEGGFDGTVLEIAIGGGAYTDILAAGGSFVTGGYNRTISSNFSSPIAGRQAWSASSGGYITTTVNLPAAAAGQSIQLRWRTASDTSIAGTGQRIDNISIINGYQCATAPSDLSIAKSVSSNIATPGQTITYTLSYSNTGGTAHNVIVTDTLPITLTNVSYTSSGPVTQLPGPNYSWQVGDLLGGAGGVITVTGVISPDLDAPTTLLNSATIGSDSGDTNPSDNTSNSVAVDVVIPQVAFSSAAYSVNEGAGTATISVTVTPIPGLPIQVNYATGGGTATPGSDYQTASGTLAVPAGASEASFTITINDDPDTEAGETVGLTLSSPSGATLGSPATATLTIQDDDGSRIYLPLVKR